MAAELACKKKGLQAQPEGKPLFSGCSMPTCWGPRGTVYHLGGCSEGRPGRSLVRRSLELVTSELGRWTGKLG